MSKQKIEVEYPHHPKPKTILPVDGMSRWSQLKDFLPFSREKFRQLAADGRAPRGIRMGNRCTLYRNSEILRFIADPLNYRVEV